MVRILIFEGNSPARVANGFSGSMPFLRTFEVLGVEVDARIINPFERVVAPAEFHGIDGAIFTGSGMPWCVDAPEVSGARRTMERALNAGCPIWGSCNGMQLAALVLGGACGASRNGIELGMARDMRLTKAGEAHPMMAGRRDGFAAPCIHRDVVQRLPKDAVHLAGNVHTPVQAFAWSDGAAEVWAAQYHPELTLSDVARYIRARGIFERETEFLSDLDQAEHDTEALARLGTCADEVRLEARARELINWLAHVEARAARQSAA